MSVPFRTERRLQLTCDKGHTLWYSSVTSQQSGAGAHGSPGANGQDPFSTNTNSNQPLGRSLQQQQQQQHHAAASTEHARNPLAALRAQENFIAARKAHIARFGACWIRPPGVGKTYQAAMDEAAEREEAERLAEREAAMVDEEDEMDDGGEEGEDEGEAEGEGEGWEQEEDGIDREDAAPRRAGIQGAGRRVVGAGLGEQDLLDDGEPAERDLDEEVPEAGSYQHTDTEVEDDEDDVEADDDLSSLRGHVEEDQDDDGDSEDISMSGVFTSPGVPTTTTPAARQDTGLRSSSTRLSGASSVLGSGSSPVAASNRGRATRGS